LDERAVGVDRDGPGSRGPAARLGAVALRTTPDALGLISGAYRHLIGLLGSEAELVAFGIAQDHVAVGPFGRERLFPRDLRAHRDQTLHLLIEVRRRQAAKHS